MSAVLDRLLERAGIELKEIEEIVTPFKVPLSIVLGVMAIESNGMPNALRYERRWRYFHYPEVHAKYNATTIRTERQLQKFSWGLMQVMGAVARELGYKDELPKILNPRANVTLGAMKLAKLSERYNEWSDIISAYNQGSVRMKLLRPDEYRNQDYVDKVIYWMRDNIDYALITQDREKYSNV